ncbi:MAG: sporulation protein YqfD [Clostridiales bacterium]|nr:sporulation protein YqfD [Clostridiales bacterium]
MDYTVFRTTALNCRKTLSAITKKNIVMYDVLSSNGELTFKVNRNDAVKIIAFFEEMCYTYRIVKQGGIGYGFLKLLKRKGLVAGILIVCTIFGLMGSRLNEIKVSGLKTVEYSDIIKILEAEGIKKGVYTKNIDKKHIEYIITSSIERIAFASIKISGMTLFINIYEELPPPDVIDMTRNQPVTAKKDGIITRMTVFQGTPVVKVNDPVRVGDVLIAPFIDVGGEPFEIRAIGDVYAKVYVKGEAVFFEETVSVTRTGESKLISELDIFGMKFGKPVSPYELYEEKIVREYIFASVPIKIVRHYYFELTARTVKMKFEDELSRLIELAKKNASAKLPKDALIMDEWHMVREGAGGEKIVEYYYEVEEKIS